MFRNILRLEGQRTFQRPLFWGSLLILAVFTAFFSTMFYIFRGGLPLTFLTWPGSLVYALNNAIGFASWSSYGTYFLIILVGVVTTQDYSWRTIQLWFSHGVPRTSLLYAKLLLTLVAALAIVLVCLLTLGILTAFFSVQTSGSVATQHVNWLQLLLSILRTGYAMLPYAALTFYLAVVSRSAVVAVGGGLAFIAIGETALSNLLPLLGSPFAHAAQYLPNNLAIALNSQNYALANLAAPTNPLQPVPIAAALGIALYTLIFVLLALATVRRQDLTH